MSKNNCKGGVCKRKVSFRTKGGEIVDFSAKPRPNLPGLHTTEIAKAKAYRSGVLDSFSLHLTCGLIIGICIGLVICPVLQKYFTDIQHVV